MTGSQKRQLFAYRENNQADRGAESARRFYDPRFDANAIMVLPGRHYVTSDPNEMIVTLLGSCVSACIRDPVATVGGLNHFLLPESDSGRWGTVVDAAMRYGNHAMETLINEIIRRGGVRSRLEVKVFGGSHVIEGTTTAAVGMKNVQFVEQYLRNEGIMIAAKHLGGNMPRRIHYFPVEGKVKMRLLQRGSDKELFRKEMNYRQQIEVADDSGDAELFD